MKLSYGAIILLLWLLSAGCGRGARDGDVGGRLQGEDPSQRARAAVEAGRAGDARLVPLLVDRLEDDEADVRLFAFESLRRLTGHSFGYRYYACAFERAEAVARWRDWVLHGQSVGPSEPAQALGPDRSAPAAGG